MKIYVDMDGTLVEWKKGTPFENVCKKGYFLNLKPTGNLINVLHRMISEGYDINILSSYLDNGHALEEKNKWLDKYFNIPKNKRTFVKYGDSKVKYSDGKAILIDDYNLYLNDWKGTSIKALNGLNSDKSFNGPSINIHDSEEKIYTDIIHIIKEETKNEKQGRTNNK